MGADGADEFIHSPNVPDFLRQMKITDSKHKFQVQESARREKELRGKIAQHLQRIGCLEKEIATGQGRASTVSIEKEVGGENKRLFDIIVGMKNEKDEARKREELKGEIKKNLQKIGSLEKEKVEIRGRAETLERRETEIRDENTRLLQKIDCLEKDKETSVIGVTS